MFKTKFPETPYMRVRNKKARIAGSGIRSRVFPSDLGAHYVLFQFHKYDFLKGGQPHKTTEYSIALPPPQSMQEKHNVSYNNAELGIVAGQLLNLFAGSLNLGDNQGSIGPKTLVSNIIAEAKDFAGSLGNASVADRLAIASGPLRQGTSAMASAATVAFANAPNPHVTAVFRGVQLNEHTFQWNLSPRSAPESYMLSNIIQAFKRAALPSYHDVGNVSGALLTFPKIVSIIYMGNIHPKLLYQFKDCVIKSITAEYAPNGPSFFAGTGAPTHVNLTLNIQEIQIHTADDHPEVDDPFPGQLSDRIAAMGMAIGSQVSRRTDDLARSSNAPTAAALGRGIGREVRMPGPAEQQYNAGRRNF